MAQLQVVFTNRAPQPLPQFSQAVKHNGMVYFSGNIGIAPPQPNWLEGLSKIGRQACLRQALRNLSVILEAAGSSLQNAVKMDIYLTTMVNFAMMNEAYDELFVWETKPCRTCVAVCPLPFGTDVEIECIAFAIE